MGSQKKKLLSKQRPLLGSGRKALKRNGVLYVVHAEAMLCINIRTVVRDVFCAVRGETI
jgi:hypothetical protein